MMTPEGSPGKDAVAWRIDVSPGAWSLDSSGHAPSDVKPTVTVWRTTGATQEDMTALVAQAQDGESQPSSGIRLYFTTDDGIGPLTLPANHQLDPNMLNGGMGCTRLELELREYADAAGTGDYSVLARFACSIARQGLPGKTPAPIRMREWVIGSYGETYLPGDPYFGDEFTDIVYTIDAASGEPNYYLCVQRFTRAESQKNQTPDDVLSGGKKCFISTTQYQLLATKLFLAKRAFIQNLAVNDFEARANGVTIRIDPATAMLTISRSETDVPGLEKIGPVGGGDVGTKQKSELLRMCGLSIPLAQLLPIAAAWSGLPTSAVNRNSTGAEIDTGWVNAGTLSCATGGGTTTVCCQLVTTAADAASTTMTGTTFPQYKVATARADVRIIKQGDAATVYDSASAESASPKNNTNGQGAADSRTATLSASIPQGVTAQLQYRLRIGYDNPASIGEGVSATASIGGFSASSASAPAYNAKALGNGFVWSSANNDYVYVNYEESAGMRFAAENKNGFGLKVDSTGIWGKTNNSEWKRVKLEE